jgi:two-component system chemotaxis response regulator CheY
VPFTVLVVDDASFMRSMIRDIFARAPFVVAGEAENGVEGIRLYRELHPDLTTMDIVMPQMDGITAGASDFIVKPFQPGRVLKVAQSVLGLNDQFFPLGQPGVFGEVR